MIHTEDISLVFDNYLLFNNLNIIINDFEKIAITGISGSGKSSFLHLLLGFYRPNKGRIIIDKEIIDAKNILKIRKNISWLPQDTNIPCTSVRELLLYVFQYKKNVKSTPDEESICNMLESLDLDRKILVKSLSEISGGQKQRILLASILLLNKPYIFLDEPTSALDDAMSKRIFDRLLNMKTTTILLASHNSYWIKNANKILNFE